MYRYHLILLLFSFVLFPAKANSTAPSAEEIRFWQSDLTYLHNELERRHYNLYHQKSKTTLTREFSDLRNKLPTLTQEQLMVQLMQIVQGVGDGHTMLKWNNLPIQRYPIQLKYFDGDWRVIAASAQHIALLGTKLIAINQQPIHQIAKRVGDISPTQSESSAARIYATAQAMIITSVLQGLGITSENQAQFEFLNEQDQTIQATLSAVPSAQEKSWVYIHEPNDKHPYQGEVNENTDGLDYYQPQGSKTAYIDFNRYPGYLSMLWFGLNVKDAIKEGQIDNLVIDFRDNRGGDFYVGLMLTQFLLTIDSLNWQNGIYVLINEGTYSAASSNAIHFRQILNAKIVGQPSGGAPHGIQDVDSITLPNSGWKVKYSKRKFRFTDVVSDGIQPDVFIANDWNDYKQGLDTAMKWVLDDINQAGSREK